VGILDVPVSDSEETEFLLRGEILSESEKNEIF